MCQSSEQSAIYIFEDADAEVQISSVDSVKKRRGHGGQVVRLSMLLVHRVSTLTSASGINKPRDLPSAPFGQVSLLWKSLLSALGRARRNLLL